MEWEVIRININDLKKYILPELVISSDARSAFAELKEQPDQFEQYCSIQIKAYLSAELDTSEDLNYWRTSEEESIVVSFESINNGKPIMQFINEILSGMSDLHPLVRTRAAARLFDYLRGELCPRKKQVMELIGFEAIQTLKKRTDYAKDFFQGFLLNTSSKENEQVYYLYTPVDQHDSKLAEFDTQKMTQNDIPVTLLNPEIVIESRRKHLLFDIAYNPYVWEGEDLPAISENGLHYTGIVFGSYVLKTYFTNKTFLPPDYLWMSDFWDIDGLLEFLKNLNWSLYDLYISESGKPFVKVNDIDGYVFKPCRKYTLKLVRKQTGVITTFDFYSMCLPFSSFTLINKTGEEITGGVIELEFLLDDFEKYDMQYVDNPEELLFIGNSNFQFKYDVISYSEKNRYAAFLLFLETNKNEPVTVPPYGELVVEITRYPE